MKRSLLVFIALCIAISSLVFGCGLENKNFFSNKYGVFLGAEPEDVEKMESYEIIVVEGQAFSKHRVSELKVSGHKVLSYINVGSIEDYRPYFSDFEQHTLDVYENWEDEKWMDVTVPEWQDFVVNDLASELKEKGFDGLFVDNVDVYYHYHTDEVFDALTSVLKSFKDMGFYVSINGGDEYVTEYMNRYGSLDKLIDAVNQETVFTKINWDETDSFDVQDEDERRYFQKYLSDVHKHGVDVYLLEYSKDDDIVSSIKEYCDKNGYYYYVSSTLNLEA